MQVLSYVLAVSVAVLSTDFNAVIPSKLGNAKAPDKKSDVQ